MNSCVVNTVCCLSMGLGIDHCGGVFMNVRGFVESGRCFRNVPTVRENRAFATCPIIFHSNFGEKVGV
jgi:hypothetical protein